MHGIANAEYMLIQLKSSCVASTNRRTSRFSGTVNANNTMPIGRTKIDRNTILNTIVNSSISNNVVGLRICSSLSASTAVATPARIDIDIAPEF